MFDKSKSETIENDENEHQCNDPITTWMDGLHDDQPDDDENSVIEDQIG